MVKTGDVSIPGDRKKGERIKVDVVRVEPMGKGKVRIKIADTKSNIIDLQHGGKGYVVIRNLGRGRYIMREIEQIGVIKNGRYKESVRPSAA